MDELSKAIKDMSHCAQCPGHDSNLGPSDCTAVFDKDTRVIQKVSSDGLLRKNKNILQTIYIAIWCTYRTLLFDAVFAIVESLVIAGHQVLYPFIVERYRLRCKVRGNSFFDLVVVGEPPASKEGFQMQEEMKITWRQFWAVGGMIELFPAKCDEILRCGGGVCGRELSWIITTPRLSMPRRLLWIARLMACSPYTSQSWRWISAGFMFFAFKNRITDRISHAAGYSIFLSIINTQHDA